MSLIPVALIYYKLKSFHQKSGTSLSQTLFVHLSLVDFLLHSALWKESIDVDRFGLAEPVDPENRLGIVAGIPVGVKDDASICTDQIYADPARLCRDEEEPALGLGGIVEQSRVFGALVNVSWAVQAEIVRVLLPALTPLAEMFEKFLDEILKKRRINELTYFKPRFTNKSI